MFGIGFSGVLGVLGQLSGQFVGVGSSFAAVTEPERATPAVSYQLDGGSYGQPRPGPSCVLSGTKKAGWWCPPGAAEATPRVLSGVAPWGVEHLNAVCAKEKLDNSLASGHPRTLQKLKNHITTTVGANEGQRMNFMRFQSTKTICLLGILTLSACAQATGGAGTTSRGDPVASQLQSDPATRTYTLTLTNPGRWTCASQFEFLPYDSRNPSMTRTVPLDCGRGLTGTMIFTGNQFANQVVGSFRLSNGEAGQVVFGNV